MKYIFLGDVHGHLSVCHNIANYNSNATVIQTGDLGVGFISNAIMKTLPSNFKFFPGNHDCRTLCKELPSFLGDYGIYQNDFFFVSGADSIDKNVRIEGLSWWADEELTYDQAQACLKLWETSKIEVLVAHDLPQTFAESYKFIYDSSLTRNLLQAMVDVRKPKVFIHSHHHQSKKHIFNDIAVIELNINEQFPFDISTKTCDIIYSKIKKGLLNRI